MALAKELKKIADAIRGVFGSTGKIKFTNFASEIEKMAYISPSVTGRVNVVDSSTPNLYVGNNGLVTVTTNQQEGYVIANTKTKTYQLPSLAERDIMPSANNISISPGVFLTGKQTILGDENLVPSNILRKTSIFGVNGTVDTIKRIEHNKENSAYFGEQACDVARSYHLARVNGSADFKYSQSYGLYKGQVTSPEGYCYLDCSGFIGLVLRGIDYNSSPFAKNAGNANVTCSPSIVSDLCEKSPYLWADKYLDKQTDNSFSDLGISGYRSIRNAAQLGEYFYSKGCTLYEYEPNNSPSTIPNGLKAGDLIFWSKPQATASQKSRFKAISHVAILAPNLTHYYQVTGSDSSKGDTVFYSDFSTDLEYVTLIVRPNYNPVVIPVTPVNTNLLPSFYFDSLKTSPSITINGVLFTPKTDGTISVKGIASEGTTFYLRNQTNVITLEPGTYTLTGCAIHPEVDVNSSSTKWGLGIKDADTKDYLGYDRGSGDTFTITSTKKAYVYIYISESLTSTNIFNFKPKLVRTK